ncbi:hypothetical protein [Serratia rubidaea]|nr:hypothetical protein [Serratia rubidaea]MDC6120337.1 hypothetical protein [Serratia rubidaea]MEB7583786.1 hypothetical protein [Serratia rubidaea]
MRTSLCVTVFIVLTILFAFILPDGFIYGYVLNNMAISGDGEVAMDNYEFVVLLIKLGISAVLSLLIVWLGNRRFK